MINMAGPRSPALTEGGGLSEARGGVVDGSGPDDGGAGDERGARAGPGRPEVPRLLRPCSTTVLARLAEDQQKFRQMPDPVMCPSDRCGDPVGTGGRSPDRITLSLRFASSRSI